MKVAKNTVVSIAYQVRTQDGVLVDEAPANQPLEYLQGHNNLIIGLENALEGKEVGDKATIQLDSFSDQTFDSEIIFISFTPVSGQTSTVYEVRFKLPSDNDDLKYRLGMDGDVSILLDEATNTITIPLDALHQEEEKPYVLVKNTDNDSFSKKYVSLGIETDDLVEVLEGIQENDQVIISK